jgi:UDP-glucuronate 4-epimerase
MKKILVTGAAGFIGFHLCKTLIKENYLIIGLDNINDYYDVSLKFDRLKELGVNREKASIFDKETSSNSFNNFKFIRLNLEDTDAISKLFEKEKFDEVVNLAAQAGVRYSIDNPRAYVQSNLVGFLNILEGCRNTKVKHLLYASSSSVYGENKKTPFSVTDNVDHPISLYAATKKSNELMAHTYSHLYDIPITGLRFFTVYGPWGRPDMALFLFTKAIIEGSSINVFNKGKMSRDFTYIDDIISGIEISLGLPPSEDKQKAPCRIFNIGKGSPETLEDFILCIEKSLNKKAHKKMLPIQPGDVPKTWADISDLKEMGYKSSTPIEEGVDKFVKWYKKYYKL